MRAVTLAPLAILAALLLSIASPRRAYADDDLVSLVQRRCDKVPAKKQSDRAYQEVCVAYKEILQEARQREYPRQYYPIRYHVDVCADLKILGGLQKPPDHDLDEAVARACGASVTRETAATDLAAVEISLVRGLGDLLEAEAKQEALDYLLTRIGTKFCKLSTTVDARHGLKIELGKWFEKSCAVMLPGGTVDVDAFSFGALKTAFKDDLDALPRNIGALAQAWMDPRWPRGKYYVAALGVAIYVFYELSQHRRPAEILQQLGDEADKRLKGHVKCDLRTRQKVTKECALILGFELARKAASEPKNTPISVQIEHALVQFCADYGETDDLKKDGACAVSAETYERIHTDLLELHRAYRRLLALDKAVADAARTSFASDVARRAAPEWSQSLRQLLDALGKALIDVDPDHAPRIQEDLALLALSFDALDALLAEDPGAIRKALLAVLGTEQVGKRLDDPEGVRALTVVVSLATARDRNEVKGILADVTAPVGTYKVKYGTPHAIVTLNGFVGFFAGGEVRLHSRNPDGTHHDPVAARVPVALRAPVGFDLTFPVWKRFHLGLAATAIDPLALEVSTADDTLRADWKTLFEPGLYVRFGLFRSPFTVLVGGNYQWGRRTDDLCGGDRCFDGAFQLGAFLSADVPLVILR